MIGRTLLGGPLGTVSRYFAERRERKLAGLREWLKRFISEHVVKDCSHHPLGCQCEVCGRCWPLWEQ